MKNFFLLQNDTPVASILAEVQRWPEAWDLQTGRQRIAVQREAHAIPIRGIRKSKIGGRERRDVHETRFTTISRQFPRTTSFLCEWARRLDAELARAKLVCLPPGNAVYPHADRGEYYARRNRFHLTLQSEGSWMRAGEEEVRMQAGEFWWFDNKSDHEARNDGTRDRIHLIFDLEPRDGVLGPVPAFEAGCMVPSNRGAAAENSHTDPIGDQPSEADSLRIETQRQGV